MYSFCPKVVHFHLRSMFACSNTRNVLACLNSHAKDSQELPFLWSSQNTPCSKDHQELVRLCGPQQFLKYIKYTKYTNTNMLYKSKSYLFKRLFPFSILEIIEKFEVSKFRKHVRSFGVIRGWDGLYRIEETKLICAISMKLILSRFVLGRS